MSNANCTNSNGNKKRGRPEGTKNQEGHTAGRKKQLIENQSFMDSFLITTLPALPAKSHSVETQTDPLTDEHLQYFIRLSQDTLTETSNEHLVSLNTATATTTTIGEAEGLDQQPEKADFNLTESYFTSPIAQDDEEVEELESELENNDIEEVENIELDENEFQQIDFEVGSVPKGSVVDRHLAEIQRKMREGEISEHFVRTNFWIYPTSPYFVLQERNIDTVSLCIPRVFIWIPHKLQSNLKCPYCKSGIEVKGHCNNPRARRVIDLYDSFYLMTMRYVCKGNKKHFFNGYHDGFMKQINLDLQAESPAVFTHKSGVSKNMIRLMIPAFQHGIGPHRMSKILRIMHTERYNELQLQYYQRPFVLRAAFALILCVQLQYNF